jgi:1,4-alpha-glucan branching enzyme
MPVLSWLSFDLKWNIGWMSDTFVYMSKESVHLRRHHQMTFGLPYAFFGNLRLPISHNEIVHGRVSLLARMPDDTWQEFAQGAE